MQEPRLTRPASGSSHRGATDDAGEPIRAIDLRDLPADEGEGGRAMRRFVRQLNAAARHEGGLSNRGQLIVMVVALGVLAGWGMFRSRVAVPGTVLVPAFLAVLALGVGVSWFVTRRIGLRVRRGGLGRTIAARGYCGGCGYDLRRAAEERPRFVECPECGARCSPARLLSAPLGSTTWEPLGKGKGRVPVNRLLATDDRGALVRRVRSVPWRAPRAARRAWSHEQRRAMRLARRRCGLLWRVLVSLVGLALVALMAHIVLTTPNGPVEVRLGLVFGVLGLVIMVSSWVTELGVSNRCFTRAARDGGVCAACASSLGESPVDDDGFRVCGACGSSWRAPIGSS